MCSHPRKGPSLRLVRSSTSRADRRPTDSTEFTHSRLSSGHACPEPVLANDSRIIVIVLSVEPAASRRARTSCASRANSRSFEKTVSLFKFSLCLSRACLGKNMTFIYKWHRKKRFSYLLFRPGIAVRWLLRRARWTKKKKKTRRIETASLLVSALPTCLSRACLGKIMIYRYKCNIYV